MKYSITYSTLISAAFVLLMSCNQKTDGKQEENEFLSVSGAYVGEQPPEKVPRLFAPGIISTGLNERDAAFSGNGKNLFFTRFTDDKYVIMHTYEEDDRWIEPEIASFSGEYNDIEPCFARWSKGLYFISNRPVEGVEKGEYDFDIWYTYKSMAGWSEPQNIGAPVNTNNVEAYPSVTRDGTLYFVRNDSAMTRSDIYRARFDSGRFKEPEKLPEIINSRDNPFNACINRDESILVFSAYRENGFGDSDYYVSFRDEDDNWSEPVNLGEGFNTSGQELSPHFTPGGKYLFFASTGNPLNLTIEELKNDTSYKSFPLINNDTANIVIKEPLNGSSDIYWVESKVLKKLKP